jgi:hypothetical protein
VKDLPPFVIGVRMARVAIWDKVSDEGRTRTVREVLLHPSAATPAALAELVRQRAA